MATLALPQADDMPPYHVLVQFGRGVSGDAQGKALLAFERFLRELGVPAEVYKQIAADDSKLRREMTPEQRDRL